MNVAIFFILCITCAFGDNVSLRSVIVVQRHGDRTPTDFPSKDVYKDPKYWSVEPGELTTVGKQQMFSFGDWLRIRYGRFLPAYYYKKDIYVRSSSLDRCLMSAETTLAGLYPPSGDQRWSALPWMPIPVHSVPAEEDALLRMGRACPAFEPIYKKNLKTANFTQINKKNAELYKFISQNVGEKVENINDVENIYDTLTIEAENQLKLPEWTNKMINGERVFPDQMKRWSDLAYEAPTYTKELKRLGVGRFLDTVASHLEAVVKNDTTRMLAQKMVLFSGHKSTIADITNTLGFLKLSPYAGALIFELNHQPNNAFFVNIFFKGTNDLEQLKMPECEKDCPFDKFISIIQQLRLTEEQWRAECFSSSPKLFSSMATLFSVILAFGTFRIF